MAHDEIATLVDIAEENKMSNRNDLKGVLSIAPTPFSDDGSLDLGSIERLVAFYLEVEVRGITVLGVMGEADKLLPEERAKVTEAYIQAVAGRVPVIVGTTHTGTAPAISLAKQAECRGAAAVMIAPPALTGGDVDQLVYEHFNAIDKAINIPIMVQDYPPASGGLKLSVELLSNMARTMKWVKYVKLEDPPTPLKIARLRKLAGDSLGIFCGLGAQFYFEELEQGSLGTLTGFAYPEVLVDIYEAYMSGDVERAATTFYRILPLIRFESQPGISLAIRKEILRRRGLIRSAMVRAPAVPLDECSAQSLGGLLARLGLAKGSRQDGSS